ncbi:uracil-DNA glycosylase [Nonomuraea dietziae]|uniref:uracil-DNA glycosylase n=1 Tax=Nonomuraea dietziae TaxID=65515 RepID=UPI0031D82725
MGERPRAVAERISLMGEFLRDEIAEGRQYLPSGAHVLRAFNQPFDEVKVLIVGQDPYPTPGHPVGLSFSVAPDVRPLPGSLRKHLQGDGERSRPAHALQRRPDPRAEQGVLLLNRVLTVMPGKPASHRGKGWEEVTEQAIHALVARDKPMVAILWGPRRAQPRPDARQRAAHRVRAPFPAVGPAAVSSAHGPSAAPMNCSSSKARHLSSGSCPRLFSHE